MDEWSPKQAELPPACPHYPDFVLFCRKQSYAEEMQPPRFEASDFGGGCLGGPLSQLFIDAGGVGSESSNSWIFAARFFAMNGLAISCSPLAIPFCPSIMLAL